MNQVLNNTLNPVWNQTFDIVVEDGLHDLLILEVYDHDTFGKVIVLAPPWLIVCCLTLLWRMVHCFSSLVHHIISWN